MRVRNKGFACSIEDCVNSAICRGYCSSHYKKWRLYGDPLYLKPRFLTEKICTQCGILKPRSEFFTQGSKVENLRSQCKPCFTEFMKWYAFERKYGVTREDYERMLVEQDDCCALCGLPLPEDDMHIDHCHASGAVRGILHRKCNFLLGYADDNPDVLRQAIRYLERSYE